MNIHLRKGQKWADPDIEHAVWFMKRVVNEPQYAQTIGQHAADFIKTYHSPRRWAPNIELGLPP